jgi:hypothetical protein
MYHGVFLWKGDAVLSDLAPAPTKVGSLPDVVRPTRRSSGGAANFGQSRRADR